MKKEKLYAIIMKNESNELYITSLKDRFTPVELATQLESLVEQEIVEVDWNRGLIVKIGDEKDIIVAKNNLDKGKRNTPDYMRANKTQINKPYYNERED
ncbi:hypothetical protein SAMN04489761_0084 [Tenacibaculum sp. MAR_2009_124]|nr:hypothetical protein SAMN04489761_0084 [Tenacibaculum sp. MAR_2009_124]